MLRIFLILVSVGLLGCVTMPIAPTEVENSRIFQADFDKVWSSLTATMMEQAFPIESVEKESGIITTRFVLFADGIDADKQIKEIAERPKVFMGVWLQGRYTLNIHAKSIGDATQVMITPYIEGYEDQTERWHVCYSKGVLEKKIFDLIKRKLAK